MLLYNCGIGAVVNIKGEQSRYVVDSALTIVEKLEHRAGKDAEGKTGDGVGLPLSIVLLRERYTFSESVAFIILSSKTIEPKKSVTFSIIILLF